MHGVSTMLHTVRTPEGTHAHDMGEREGGGLIEAESVEIISM